jgi:hypothetical protein
MCADNHHEDGHLALWVRVKDGLQPLLIEDAPATYFDHRTDRKEPTTPTQRAITGWESTTKRSDSG